MGSSNVPQAINPSALKPLQTVTVQHLQLSPIGSLNIQRERQPRSSISVECLVDMSHPNEAMSSESAFGNINTDAGILHGAENPKQPCQLILGNAL